MRPRGHVAGRAAAAASSQPVEPDDRGSGTEFLFQAPYSWHVRRRDSQVQAVAEAGLPRARLRRRSSRSCTRTSRRCSPRRPGSSTADARQLATRLGGTVQQAATVTLAGIKARQYELAYESGGHDFHQRITFVLRGKTEFQLLCRWTGDEPSACGQLEKTFRPL